MLYSSYQNGTAERMNRTVLEKARALLSQGLVPAALWSDAVRYAAFLINWTPSLVLSYDAPVDVWHGRKLPRPKFTPSDAWLLFSRQNRTAVKCTPMESSAPILARHRIERDTDSFPMYPSRRSLSQHRPGL